MLSFFKDQPDTGETKSVTMFDRHLYSGPYSTVVHPGPIEDAILLKDDPPFSFAPDLRVQPGDLATRIQRTQINIRIDTPVPVLATYPDHGTSDGKPLPTARDQSGPLRGSSCWEKCGFSTSH